ncbi:hypothetical protein F4859DRAFT_460589 [Xylaria cf. heliscus]|nr:hypothetical protein F4859DRAFT_460589 [Xylaria cf. heliscus]
MDSLRAQLAETQGALTERDKKFRQLRAEHLQASTSWSEEKIKLEARIARLESENQRLKGASPAAPSEPSKPVTSTYHMTESPEITLTHKGTGIRLTLTDQQDADGNDKVTISRSRMKQAEAQFEELADVVAEKTKLIEALEAKLAQSSSAPIPALSDDKIVTRWNQLRNQVRTLTLERLSQTFSAHLVPDKFKGEFKALSPHWKTYASTPNVTCYLFRGLIWRYLLRFFKTPCRSCGRDVSNKIRAAAEALSAKVSDAEYQDWRIRTATLVHKVYPLDTAFVDEVTSQIVEVITPLIPDSDDDALKALEASLRGIVTTTAELSAAFDRSRFVVLMSNKPGSILTQGFPYVETLMDMRAKLGSQGVVDLMMTPSLLKKETEYSVLVKAEVIC